MHDRGNDEKRGARAEEEAQVSWGRNARQMNCTTRAVGHPELCSKLTATCSSLIDLPSCLSRCSPPLRWFGLTDPGSCTPVLAVRGLAQFTRNRPPWQRGPSPQLPRHSFCLSAARALLSTCVFCHAASRTPLDQTVCDCWCEGLGFIDVLGPCETGLLLLRGGVSAPKLKVARSQKRDALAHKEPETGELGSGSGCTASLLAEPVCVQAPETCLPSGPPTAGLHFVFQHRTPAVRVRRFPVRV